ncbi:MAG: hypothetical protein EBS05_27120 [Proteobacteria bacterium]|nr:hypothetical protein [Pseudomonadota bacterium]
MKPAQSPSCEHPLVSLIAGDQPISFTVVAVIADSRKSARVAEVRRKLSFVATPESLASLPGNLNALVRGVGSDAQVALSKFLERLAQPEPPVPVAATKPEDSGQATVAPMETELATPETTTATGPAPVAQDYLLLLNLPLLGTLP